MKRNRIACLKFIFVFVISAGLFMFFCSLNQYGHVGEYSQTFSDIVQGLLSTKEDELEEPSPARIFCFILTREKNIETKGRTAVNVWGHKCDNYKLISNIPGRLWAGSTTPGEDITEEDNVTVTFAPEWGDILQPPGLLNDTYKKLTDKVFRTVVYLYENYNDYDWYLKADDDTFVFVDNLRDFVSDKSPSEPVWFGYDFKVIVKSGYHSGGAGYLLSHESFMRLGSRLSQNYSSCLNRGVEDVDMGRCLESIGVRSEKSIDDLGRERFHGMSLDTYYKGNFPKWLYRYAANPPQKGLNCCSDTSISFHYMPPKLVVKLGSIVEKLQEEKQSKLISFSDIMQEWLKPATKRPK